MFAHLFRHSALIVLVVVSSVEALRADTVIDGDKYEKTRLFYSPYEETLFKKKQLEYLSQLNKMGLTDKDSLPLNLEEMKQELLKMRGDSSILENELYRLFEDLMLLGLRADEYKSEDSSEMSLPRSSFLLTYHPNKEVKYTVDDYSVHAIRTTFFTKLYTGESRLYMWSGGTVIDLIHSVLDSLIQYGFNRGDVRYLRPCYDAALSVLSGKRGAYSSKEIPNEC